LIALLNPLTIVLQLLLPILPDRSRMKPSWMTPALAARAETAMPSATTGAMRKAKTVPVLTIVVFQRVK
jgi:hypothetical protein